MEWEHWAARARPRAARTGCPRPPEGPCVTRSELRVTKSKERAAACGRSRNGPIRSAEHLLAAIVRAFARELVRLLELRHAIGHFAAPQALHAGVVCRSAHKAPRREQRVPRRNRRARSREHRLGPAGPHQRAPPAGAVWPRRVGGTDA